MTIKFLLDAVEKDLKEVLKDYRLVNQRDKITKINIYQYNIPVKKEEEDEAHFPYIIIMPEMGELDMAEETVTTTISFGVYDDNDNKQGFADILNMIEKYKNHLVHERVIDGYEVLYPIKWEMQDEDSHPAYFGGIAVTWKMRQMKTREESNI